jgi:hypothetical protein
MVAGLPGLRDLDICGCEQLGEDAIVALSGLRHLTALNVGSCQQAVTNRRALLNPGCQMLLYTTHPQCFRASSHTSAWFWAEHATVMPHLVQPQLPGARVAHACMAHETTAGMASATTSRTHEGAAPPTMPLRTAPMLASTSCSAGLAAIVAFCLVSSRGCRTGLRHLIAEDCTQLSSRGIAALTGLTVCKRFRGG